MFCRLAILMAEKNAKLTQKQLAKDTGLSPTTVHQLFNNDFRRVDTHTIEAICNYFGCQIGDLFELRDLGSAS